MTIENTTKSNIEFKQRADWDVYSPARVTPHKWKRSTFILHEAAYALHVMNMSNNYVDAPDCAESKWLLKLAKYCDPDDRLRPSLMGLKLIVSFNFLQHLGHGAVVNGLWPSSSRSSSPPLLTDAFIMFHTGFFAASDGEPIVALAVENEQFQNESESSSSSEEVSDDWSIGLSAVDVAKKQQPFTMKTVMRLSSAKKVLSAQGSGYLCKGTLSVVPFMRVQHCLFAPDMSVRVRGDNPVHAVERDARMEPVYRVVYGNYICPFGQHVWPLNARVAWLLKSLEVSVEVARVKGDTRLAHQYWFRFLHKKNVFKGLSQLLLGLVDPDHPEREVPLVAVLEKWTPPGESPFYSLVTVLTRTQAYTNARAFEQSTNFDS